MLQLFEISIKIALFSLIAVFLFVVAILLLIFEFFQVLFFFLQKTLNLISSGLSNVYLNNSKVRQHEKNNIRNTRKLD